VTALLALAAAYAALMLWRYGRRGVLFLAPGLLRLRSDAAAPPATVLQRQAGEELESLGFSRLGARSEEGPLGGLGLASDAWVNEGRGTYADVFEQAPRAGAGPRLYFLSVFPDGAVALTANHPRRARSDGAVEVASLVGAGAAPTFEAHLRTLGEMVPRHGAPAAAPDLAVREKAARTFYRRAGNRELRARFLAYFLNALLAALILGGALHMLLLRNR